MMANEDVTKHADQWATSCKKPKQEPIDLEEEQDFGINSGNDRQPSQPGSDPSLSPSVDQKQVLCNSTPMTRTDQRPIVMDQEEIYTDHLTPPSSEPVSPPDQKQNDTIAEKLEAMDVGRAPCGTPELVGSHPVPEENQMPPPPSPKTSASIASEKLIKKMKTPKTDSRGNVKVMKCKQCDHETTTKWDYYVHRKVHIRPDRQRCCLKCPFVTDVKHHLEFHEFNHEGKKPFKCERCNYSCANKSMLTSHMKSHSDILLYHCADCAYATKYCHALKKHAKKSNHRPGMVLNPDGTPNPTVLIDVNGRRRGPTSRNTQEKPPVTHAKGHETASSAFAPQAPLAFPGQPFLPEVSAFQPLPPQNPDNVLPTAPEKTEDAAKHPETESAGALDLCKPKVQRRPRKGRPVKLLSSSDSTEFTTMFSNVEVVETEGDAPEEVEMKPDDDLTCQYCSIEYGDRVMYTMHMGYHAYGNPFTCNMCGEACGDKISFCMHLARKAHP